MKFQPSKSRFSIRLTSRGFGLFLYTLICLTASVTFSFGNNRDVSSLELLPTTSCCRDTTAAFGDTVVLASTNEDFYIEYELLEAPEPIHLIGTGNHILIANEVGVAQLRAYLLVANTTDTTTFDFSVTITKADPVVEMLGEPIMVSIYDRNIPVVIQTNYDGEFDNDNIQDGWVWQPEQSQFQKPGKIGTTLFKITGPATAHYNAVNTAISLTAYRPGFEIFGLTSIGIYHIDSIGNAEYLKVSSSREDGVKIQGGLVEYGDYLYGTANEGGTANVGVIFRFNKSTHAYEVVHNFDGTSTGNRPTGRLLVHDGKLWGTTVRGGNEHQGILFSYDPSTDEFQVNHLFDDLGGIGPNAPLISHDGKLWGTTTKGGVYNTGVIFTFDPAIDQFNIVHHFDERSAGHFTALYEHDGLMYGCNETSVWLGPSSIFSFNIDTKEYKTILTQGDINSAAPSDSDFSYRNLVSSVLWWDGKLYGTVRKPDWDVDIDYIFRCNPDGTEIEVLKSSSGSLLSREFTVWDNQIWTASFYTGISSTIEGRSKGNAMSILPAASLELDNKIPLFFGAGYYYKTQGGSLIFPNDPMRPTLRISVKDTSRYEGQGNPEFDIHFEGFYDGDTEAYIAQLPDVICEADSSSGPGTYSVTLEGAIDEFYDFEYVSGTLTVLPKVELQVSVQDTSRLEGEENPEFMLVFEGLEEGDSASDIDEFPTISTEANTSSAPGTYEIALAGGHDDKYQMVLGSGTLTVRPNEVTSLQELSINHSVYPVPFKTGFTVQFSESLVTSKYQVLVYTSSGTVVHNEYVAGDVESHPVIGLEDQPAGVFILKIVHDQGATSQVLIKE